MICSNPVSRRAAMGLVAGAALSPLTLRAQTAPVILATTAMIADAAQRLCGLPVHALIGPGMDPHGYRQTRSDIAAMARADLVLWHGLYLEAQLEVFLQKLARNRPVMAIADRLPKNQLRGHDEYQNRYDPHIWMDPALWAQAVVIIGQVIRDIFPDLGPQITNNLPPYLAEITALDQYSRTVLATIPAAQRVLVTAHDAFGYFGRTYGFEVLGIQGISTQSEAGLSRITRLVNILVERRIPAVFVETSVSDHTIRALIEGAGARGHIVTIGGALYSDAMGFENTYEGTWLGMIDYNITTITRALGGTAPQGGRLNLLKAPS